MKDQVRDFNKEYHYGLDLLHKGAYKKCLFEHDCTEPTILAHSVSLSVLKSLQHNGEVVAPAIRISKDPSGRSRPNLTFEPEVVTRASTGTFTCQAHDSLFHIIDTGPFDFDNTTLLNLLYYRAVLKETWLLSKMRAGIAHLEEKGPLPTPLSIHPGVRLRALRDSINGVRPFLETTDCPLVHIVRHVKTPHPILAASCAGASSHIVNGVEIPVTWTFSVLPQASEHVIVASFLKGNIAEKYVNHFRETNGRELQAAISAELIYFGENWFIHPKVWFAYGKRKQAAITDAYNNFEEMLIGNYKWLDKEPRTPWYKYMGVSNRHQLNLFRYDESMFKS